MSLDSLSFAAPARVKVLVVPVGRIRRSRFLSFLERLRQENVIRLGDVSPDGRPHRSMAPMHFSIAFILQDFVDDVADDDDRS